MKRFVTTLIAVCFLLYLPFATLGKANVVKPTLRVARRAETDLEVGGELDGLPPGSTRFISYTDLLTLPQVTYAVSDDPNFAGKTLVSGIPLEQLAPLLGAASGAKLVVAICYDGYRTNYPAAYIAAHHPLLVLKINGKVEAGWPKSAKGGPLGPYLISHPLFNPSFKVLAHTDEPQIPFGVTRIELRGEQAVMASIAPRGKYAPDSPVVNGYRIAQQNCFRCHNMGADGGQMSGRSWQVLAMWAATEPQYFSRYVKNPQAIDSKNHMPGNPQYDAATIEALRRYFATFAGAGQSRGLQ
jgi:hypothetical protein